MTARRPWALPLVPLYCSVLAAKNGLRRSGALGTRALNWPVISVGSLSAGGAGKTPVVIALAELLGARGWRPDILSRGYGRESTAVERVRPELADAARRFGDEPVLIASRTGLPVWVGASRFAAGAAAEQAALGGPEQAALGGDAHRTAQPFGRPLHLLDDGFQHRALARTVDVVLLTGEDLEDVLLPAGNLREPLAALRRADAVVLREEELAQVSPRVARLVRPGVPVWTIRRRLSFTAPGAPSNNYPGAETGEEPEPAAYVAFCGIARPRAFFAALRAAGLQLVEGIPFPDHHRYTSGDVRRVVHSCHLGGCRFITTEKDAVKLGPELRAQLEAAGPLHIARLDAEFLDPERVARTLEARLG